LADHGDEDALDGDSCTDVEQLAGGQIELAPIRSGMVLAERWAIEAIVGQGGMGIVARAYDRALGVTVAVKIVRAELASERSWSERLAREVKLARQIHHPNVCRVFELGEHVGRVFLVMELATNGTLRDELRAGTYAARPLADRLADARAVAAGLAAIHAAGIVHRDVSPQNLLRMDDGRVVVSDFGLATDDVDNTTSVVGGTIAYMAPELVRGGGRATVASDVWALGVVIYELVFGTKPTWRERVGTEMRPPSLGRPLTALERAAFETCRACTTSDVAARTVTAAEVDRVLRNGTRPTRPWPVRLSRRSVAIGAAAIAIGVSAFAIRSGGRLPPPSPEQSMVRDSPLIVPTGEPADWTDKSLVLAAIPERIRCTTLLPDHRTIRFVWGTPPRAEDIDTTTRRRVPSPLVPETYAEGCPELSPDGRRLAYQGHTKDGRPFAFVSENSEGRDAVPVVQTAEPSMSSDPSWVSEDWLSYEVDTRHIGVFSMTTRRAVIVPDVSPRSYPTSFRSVGAKDLLVWVAFDPLDMELVRLGVPSLKETARFRMKEFVMDFVLHGNTLYGAAQGAYESNDRLLAIDVSSREARQLGRIPGQFIRYPRFADAGMAFVSIGGGPNLYARSTQGLVRLTNSDDVYHATHCGAGIVAVRDVDHRAIVERLDRDGRIVEILSGDAGHVTSVSCSPDGEDWFISRLDHRPMIQRCHASDCRSVASVAARSVAVSPDGSRIAILSSEERGPIVSWIAVGGGEIHEVAESETACEPGWASKQTLWVSRRRSGGIVWTEVDAVTGRETGKVVQGERDCTDGKPDPASPVDPDVRIVYSEPSQLRLIGHEHLRDPGNGTPRIAQ